MSVYNALSDLAEEWVLEKQKNIRYFKWTQRGREVLQTGLLALWPSILDQYLTSEQLELLTKLAQIGQESHETYVSLRDCLIVDIGAELGDGWNSDRGTRVYHIAQELKKMGLARTGGGMGALTARPTYRGIVRATRQVDTEWQSIIRRLLPDWETTNVEFKQELNLRNAKQKAEFVKDILSLVTTKSSGRRFMLIGFDDKTHNFKMSVDPSITQDRLEQILDAYADPVPTIRYQQVSWELGTAGAIEIFREAHKLPYKVKADLEHISQGDVYVRHGSHNVKLQPTDEEYDDLLAEGERARQQ
jgi:hypothetical protein